MTKQDAELLGKAAHENRLPCKPTLDAKLMKTIKKMLLSDAAPLMRAWIEGWKK